MLGVKGPAGKAAAHDAEPERNFAEERLRHAARLVKAVHAHDIEGAEDAMSAHHATCADEHEAMQKD